MQDNGGTANGGVNLDQSPNSFTFNVTPVNDAAVITGTSTASLTETNAVLKTGGTLSATDVDSSAAFVAQTNAAGSNGYGTFIDRRRRRVDLHDELGPQRVRGRARPTPTV